jgi:hypothetical protein
MAIKNVAIINKSLTPTDIANNGWSINGDGFLVNDVGGAGALINENGESVTLADAVVPSSAVTYRHTIISVPEGRSWAITNILICNKYNPYDTNPEAQETVFDMYIVPNGRTATPDTTVVVRKLLLPAGETFTFDSEKIVLDEFDRIIIDGQAPGNLIVVVSYLEV